MSSDNDDSASIVDISHGKTVGGTAVPMPHVYMSRKRRHSSSSIHPCFTPLKIPSSSLNEIEHDAFEFNSECFTESSSMRIPRPLPAMSSSMATQVSSTTSTDRQEVPAIEQDRGLSMPLLVKFQLALRSSPSQGKGNNAKLEQASTTLQQVDGTRDSASIEIVPMEDSSQSTLSEGQHVRFLQLQHEKKESQSPKWSQAKGKEYQKLLSSVQKEQAKYQTAVEAHVDNHLDVFLVGFEKKNKPSHFSAAVALLNSKHVAGYREMWKTSNRALTFGKCTQTISLPAKGDGSHLSRRVTNLESLVIRNEVVHANSAQVEPRLPSVNAERFQSDKNVPLTDTQLDRSMLPATTCLLRDDATTQELAAQHKVDVVTTKETLEALLQLPGHVATKWMIPTHVASASFTRRTGTQHQVVVWLDSPVPQARTPRDCLTRGYEAVLYQHLAPSSMDSEADQDSLLPRQRVYYTLLTLGKTGAGPASRTGVKVLVKSTNRLVLVDNGGKTPLCIRAQLDYFENQNEEFTSTQKACWILDKILQPSCRVMVGRACPHSAILKSWEETSVAHALSSNNIQPLSPFLQHDDPMDRWIAMVHFLNSLQTMGEGEQMLCLPARDLTSHSATTCVSVHHKSEQQTTDPIKIDLEQEFQNARAVYTGQAALRQCFQPFQWHDPDRIPFTFPIRKRQEGKREK